jgi:hypothetical protein
LYHNLFRISGFSDSFKNINQLNIEKLRVYLDGFSRPTVEAFTAMAYSWDERRE